MLLTTFYKRNFGISFSMQLGKYRWCMSVTTWKVMGSHLYVCSPPPICNPHFHSFILHAHPSFAFYFLLTFMFLSLHTSSIYPFSFSLEFTLILPFSYSPVFFHILLPLTSFTSQFLLICFNFLSNSPSSHLGYIPWLRIFHTALQIFSSSRFPFIPAFLLHFYYRFWGQAVLQVE
jgi:hypothetical protein